MSVALHTTAGESDYDSDRLSNLKKVGNGFRPLIFDLLRNKSFDTFRRGCLAVWEALKTDPDLPQKLVCAATSVYTNFYNMFINFANTARVQIGAGLVQVCQGDTGFY